MNKSTLGHDYKSFRCRSVLETLPCYCSYRKFCLFFRLVQYGSSEKESQDDEKELG